MFKVTPYAQGIMNKSLVNIYTFDSDHFEDQSINLKKLKYKYNARVLVIDGAGMGSGLIDYMVKSQIDPETRETLPPFGIYNDEDRRYTQYITPETEKEAIYIMKANAPLNTEMYSYTQTQILSGRVKFLIDEKEAKARLMSSSMGQSMSPAQRNEYLRPYVQTSILKEQVCNLVEENEGVNIILKQSSRSIKKDKFSSLIYGLYFIKLEEEKKRNRRKFNIKDFLLFN